MEISKFFSGKSLLITGGTGFIGKGVVEKILRSCSEVEKIYILVRNKNGLNVQERISKTLKSPIFDLLKRALPEQLKKIIGLSGDITLPNLGLSESDLDLIKNNVTIIIHMAANMQFNNDLKSAMTINVGSTIELIKIAKTVKNLVSLVYVSTAYSNCHLQEIEEKIYEMKQNPYEIFETLKVLDKDSIELITENFISPYPNTHTFTKALCEQIMNIESETISISIVRPSIVMNTLKEPMPGFTDNLAGTTELIYEVLQGVQTNFLVNPRCIGDVIPLDKVVNMIIAVTWKNSINGTGQIGIYNCCRGSKHPMQWRELSEVTIEFSKCFPYTEVIRTPNFVLHSNSKSYSLANFFTLYLPFTLMDLKSRLNKEDPKMRDTYEKIQKATQANKLFGKNEWKFTTENSHKLFKEMTDLDRISFNFDTSDFIMRNFLINACYGTQRYMIKDKSLLNPPISEKFLSRQIGPLRDHLKRNSTACLEMENSLYGFKSGIKITNASKVIGKCKILNNLQMNVKEGTIYALLGSSGCGKTTLLSCCVGIQKLDQGEIEIFGNKMSNKVLGKNVGYMPQEIALHGEFTISEIMNYFGKIVGMKKQNISERMSFFIKLLDLPSDLTRQVRNLSGGQQRRVSFAVALIHEPKLLILDEPTVGVDPILRESIWKYLMEICSSNKTTIVITTHYIEEATQANTLGIMRNGKILTEDSPEYLHNKYNMNIEKIILHLCQIDSNSIEDTLVNPQASPKEIPIIKSIKGIETHSDYNVNFLKENIILRQAAFKESLQRISALVWKNTLCLWRNLLLILFLFVLPALHILLCTTALGGDLNNIQFGLINYEIDSEICETFDGCIFSNLSCKFLDQLPTETLHLIKYSTEEEGIEGIEKGNIWGYMLFQKNFSENLVDVLLSSGIQENDSNTHLYSRLKIKLDMTSQQIGFTVKKVIYETFIKFSKKLLTDCEISSVIGDELINFETPSFGLNEPNFSQNITPPTCLIFIFFLAITLTGQLLIVEKKEGMFERNLVAGVTYFECIISHIISQFGIMLGQSCFAILILIFMFEFAFPENLPYIFFLTILQGFCGMLVGFILAIICKDERGVMQLSLGFLFPNFLLSGVFWPIEGMPKFLHSVVLLLPQTLACESLRSMFLRGWTINHPTVYFGFVATFIWIFVLISIICLIISFRKRNI